jgi:excisionase family DNA binding protein
MHSRARPLPHRTTADRDSAPPEVLEVAIRALIAALAAPPAGSTPQDTGPPSMLTVKQTAALMGMSRMTVIRKADSGELPCVVVSRGTRQKMRRFPRAAIEELAARGSTGGHGDLKDYTAQWLAAAASRISEMET